MCADKQLIYSLQKLCQKTSNRSRRLGGDSLKFLPRTYNNSHETSNNNILIIGKYQ